MNIDQEIINIAVNIATRAAINDRPVLSVTYVPCQKATGDPHGIFIVVPYESGSPLDTPPWERY